MLDLDYYDGTDQLGMFPIFLMRTADVMALRLSVVFRWLVRLGSFPPCWRQANVTPIPKGTLYSSVANYPTDLNNISIVKGAPGVCLSWTINGTQWCLATTQFAYWKGLGTCHALL